MGDNDRRAYKRIDNRLQVKYEVVDSNSMMPLTTYTKNVSSGGFLFRSSAPVEFGSLLRLKFYLDNLDEFVSADAKVVRIEEIVENKIYDIGIKFININDDDVLKLTKYVTNKL
ncbi:MAG TPA: PilZ domain-containing protein [Spirochaetota bacterium]|nr:PilZ domain-containing protein [Spirochaetota bacterium]